MALDLHAIATGLATRYTAANMSPPAGESATRGATATPPNNVPATPYTIVFPPKGEVTYLGGGRRDGEHDFTVVFLISKSRGDIARIATTILKWLGVLLDATHAATKLGVTGTVKKAIPTSYETGVVEYGGQDYDAITLTVRVWTEDTVTLVPA